MRARERERSVHPAEPAAGDLVLSAGELFPVHIQHSPLFFVEPLAVVPVSGAEPLAIVPVSGAAAEACMSATMVTAAGVRGGCFLRMIFADTRDLPNSSKKSLLLKDLACFQEGSTAVKSTSAYDVNKLSQVTVIPWSPSVISRTTRFPWPTSAALPAALPV